MRETHVEIALTLSIIQDDGEYGIEREGCTNPTSGTRFLYARREIHFIDLHLKMMNGAYNNICGLLCLGVFKMEVKG